MKIRIDCDERYPDWFFVTDETLFGKWGTVVEVTEEKLKYFEKAKENYQLYQEELEELVEKERKKEILSRKPEEGNPFA